MVTNLPLQGMKALVIIPGTVSYFYDAEGRRVAEALRNIGWHVDVRTLNTYEPQDYDWCFLLNLWEITFAYGNDSGVFQHIEKLKVCCKHVAMILLECVEMKWFADSFHLFEGSKLEILIDMGFHDQRKLALEKVQPFYHFIFNGLTRSEQAQSRLLFTPPEQRPIPWTFVGHMTPIRLSFVQELMENLDRGGFLYVVHFTPVTETGPHLNERQFHKVLTRTQYQIWCSHHPFFYIESIRFRSALLAGTVPIKVNLTDFPEGMPFSNLIFEKDNFAAKLRTLDFETTRERFFQEYSALPSLEVGFQDFFRQF